MSVQTLTERISDDDFLAQHEVEHAEWVDGEVVPGLWIDPEWLWGDATPPLMTVLREWGLV